MDLLCAEFRAPDNVVSAVEALRRLGVPASAMELFSRKPLEVHPSPLPRRSRMSLGAVVCAILFGGGATSIVYWMQLDYPLVTGGMPLTSAWATGVVTFETTMAGAVFGTFAMLLIESGLLSRKKRMPVPTLPDDGFVLQAACREGVEDAKAALRSCGARAVTAVDLRA